MFLIADIKKQDGQTTLISLPVMAKEFKTGSRGFYANGRVEIDGKRYTLQVQLVEIGSKTAAGEEAKS